MNERMKITEPFTAEMIKPIKNESQKEGGEPDLAKEEQAKISRGKTLRNLLT